MMTPKLCSPAFRLSLAAALAVAPLVSAGAQSSSAPKSAASAATAPAPAPAPKESKQAVAYYHAALAGMYEDQAMTEGRAGMITQAIEEYKLALDADPASPELNDELADLYYRIGRFDQAEAMAHAVVKTAPDDLDAHKLLGRIYLRQLGQQDSSVSSTSPPGNVLDLAIGEFEKIVSLEPKDIQDHMVLGQLYSVKHQPEKAAQQFDAAKAIEPDSEDVVLNLVRVYAENNDMKSVAKVINDVPEVSRTAKMELALGAAYDQLKQPKDAIAAYQRALVLDPDDPRALDSLGQDQLSDNQLDAALKTYQQLSKEDPGNVGALVHVGEILRRQGKYQEALTAIQKARKIDPTSLSAGYNMGMLQDVLGQFDDAAQTYSQMVDATSHANGAYTADEKNNRGIFLDRLGAVYVEQNKTDLAVATYQKMIDMGGDSALRGYQGQVDAYTSAKQYDKAIAVTQQAVAANPKNTDLKMMLAGELVDRGKTDEGLAMAKGLLTNKPSDRSVWIGLCQIYVRMHRWKDAEETLNKAEALTTKQDDKIYLLFLRGEVAERQKHYEPAERYFRQVLALDPNNAMTLNYLGYMLADKNARLPEALTLIRKAVQLDPMNGAYLDSLGWVYFKMGQYELAEDNLRSAVERDQTDPTVHMHLGDLYEKTGRIRLAVAQWQLSMDEYAKSSPADFEPGDVAKVQKKLESARVKLAKEENAIAPGSSQQ